MASRHDSYKILLGAARLSMTGAATGTEDSSSRQSGTAMMATRITITSYIGATRATEAAAPRAFRSARRALHCPILHLQWGRSWKPGI